MEILALVLIFTFFVLITLYYSERSFRGRPAKGYKDEAVLGQLNLVDKAMIQSFEFVINNMSMGYLVYDSSLMLDELPSQSTLDMVGDPSIITDRMNQEISKIATADEFMQSLFSRKRAQRKLYLGYLPHQILLGERMLSLSYAFYDEKNLLYVFIKDETAWANKLSERDETIDAQHMAISVLKNQQDYTNLLYTIDHSVQSITERLYLESENKEDFMMLVIKLLNDMRPLLMMFHFKESLRNLDALEQSFSEYSKGNADLSEVKLFVNTGDLGIIIRNDRQRLVQYVGHDFMMGETMPIHKNVIHRLKKLNQNMAKEMNLEHIQQEIHEMVTTIDSEEIFSKFDRMDQEIQEYAKQIYKKVQPIDYRFDSGDAMKRIILELIHGFPTLFHASVEFSVESPAVRFRNGKQEAARITVNFYEKDGQFMVTYADDGKGYGISEMKEMCEEIEVPSSHITGILKQDYIHPKYGVQILNQYIQQHGGKIKVESLEGEYFKLSGSFPMNAMNFE